LKTAPDGVGVRAGASSPDLSTPDTFKADDPV
jgi:hypothetical protein